jgi:hypothetical protein
MAKLRDLGIWITLSASLGAAIGWFAAEKLSTPERNFASAGPILGSAIGITLPIALYVAWRLIPAVLKLFRRRTLVRLEAFSRTYRFSPDQKVELPFEFIDRNIDGKNALKEAVRRLRKGSLIIWDGGGEGKTALAAAALCKRHLQLNKGGSIWINADGRDLTSFLNELAVCLGLQGVQDLRTAVRIQLSTLGPVLIVADNLETSQPEVLQFLRTEIPANCQLLTTTRHWDQQEYLGLGEPFRIKSHSLLEMRQFGLSLLRQRAKERKYPLSPTTEEAILGKARGNPKVIDHLLGQIEARGTLPPFADVEEGSSNVLNDTVGRSFDSLGSNARRVLFAISLFATPASVTSLKEITAVARIDIALEELWKRRLADHSDDGELWSISNHVKDYVNVHPVGLDQRMRFVQHFANQSSEIKNSEESLHQPEIRGRVQVSPASRHLNPSNP